MAKTDDPGTIENEPAEVPAGEAIPASEQVSRYSPYSDDWDSLTGEADTVFGYDLAKDEIADALTGIPFIITSATFRPGITRKTPEGNKQYAYVSLETVISPTINLTRVNAAREASKLPKLEHAGQLPFDLGGHVVVNDGSTGIYRQIVQYLRAKDMIGLPEPIKETGEIGESTYDLPPGDWTDTGGMYRFDEGGNFVARYDVRLKCPRGLRLSKYENNYTAPGEQATTRYLG